MTIGILLSLLLVWAGHTELCVTVINRLHALPIRCRTLKRIRHVHDVAIVAFPAVVVALWGIDAPARFLSGDWAGLSLAARSVFVLSLLGAAGLVWSTIRWWLGTRRSMKSEVCMSLVDVPRELGESPIGKGSLRWLARVPGNEQFLIDLNEKTLSPPNWPEDLDGLSILHLSDWHLCETYSRRFFECAAEQAASVRADLVAFTGDLFDDEVFLDWLPSTIGLLNAPLGKWFILGNHDSWRDNGDVRGSLKSLGWSDVCSSSVRIDAGPAEFWLGGDETPWIGNRPTWETSTGARVLLSHTPDNFPRASTEGIDVVLSGHNHGGQVLLPVIGPVYSPSRYGCCYPAGVFRRGSSVMHVSRGLAGRHPLRIGCRPEITRLILRSPQKRHASDRATMAARDAALDRAGGPGAAGHGRPATARR